MGLFGPSKSELADRIDELEATVQEQKAETQRALDRAKHAKVQAKRAEVNATESAEDAAQIAHALNNFHTSGLETVEDKDGVVETFDEPRIAWKATKNNVAKLLIPEGATVVHPRKDDVFHGGKKRTDEAVPIAFFDVVNRIGINTPSSRGDAPNTEVSDRSQHLNHFEYDIGETVEPNQKLDTRLDDECTHGIHFFTTEEEAVEWY